MLDRIFSRLSAFSVPLICFMLVGYFAYHAFYGGNGMLAAESLQERIVVLDAEYLKATETRDALEKKVALLRPESLDPDILDELARSSLGKVHKNDIVVILR